ncbi:MAG: hypothetical protein Q8916_13675 [Bacteroidota bacterium]|nr:hypothetical protein [Bacteroidota bacterium]MDP4231443.1 hypothetical protein [Bacteroidota bacterium]MDP4237346.1 hypothetical protein [Bacteroidota bacterium]
MTEYKNLLEDQIFMKGDTEGRIGTALTILTDMLIDLNALEIYYQKPSSKELSPREIEKLREKIAHLKLILQTKSDG